MPTGPVDRRRFALSALAAAGRAGAQEKKQPAAKISPVASKVKEVLARQLGVDESAVIDSARLVEDLAADSLDVCEVVMALEEEFNIDIPDADVPGPFRTVGGIIAYIEPRVRGKRNQAKVAKRMQPKRRP